MRSMTYLPRRARVPHPANKYRRYYWQCGTRRGLLSDSGAWCELCIVLKWACDVGRGLLCLTLELDARFAVPESVAWVEVCCVWHWGTRQSLLCMRVWRGARFVVSDSLAWSEFCCAWECGLGRGMLCLRVAWGEVCWVWQWGTGRGLLYLTIRRGARFAVSDTEAQGDVAVPDSRAQGEVYWAWQ